MRRFSSTVRNPPPVSGKAKDSIKRAHSSGGGDDDDDSASCASESTMGPPETGGPHLLEDSLTIRAGWLQKQTTRKKLLSGRPVYSKRYFLLRQSSAPNDVAASYELCWYESLTSDNVKGTLCIEAESKARAQDSLDKPSSRKYVFDLTLPGRTLLLRAASQESRDSWVAALRDAAARVRASQMVDGSTSPIAFSPPPMSDTVTYRVPLTVLMEEGETSPRPLSPHLVVEAARTPATPSAQCGEREGEQARVKGPEGAPGGAEGPGVYVAGVAACALTDIVAGEVEAQRVRAEATDDSAGPDASQAEVPSEPAVRDAEATAVDTGEEARDVVRASCVSTPGMDAWGVQTAFSEGFPSPDRDMELEVRFDRAERSARRSSLGGFRDGTPSPRLFHSPKQHSSPLRNRRVHLRPEISSEGCETDASGSSVAVFPPSPGLSPSRRGSSQHAAPPVPTPPRFDLHSPSRRRSDFSMVAVSRMCGGDGPFTFDREASYDNDGAFQPAGYGDEFLPRTLSFDRRLSRDSAATSSGDVQVDQAVSAVTALNAELKATLESARAEKAEAVQREQAALVLLEEVRGRERDLQQQLRALQVELERAHESAEGLLMAAKARAKHLEEELAALKAEAAERQDAADKLLQEERRARQEEVARLRADTARLQGETEEMLEQGRQRMKELEGQVEKVREDADKGRAEAQQLVTDAQQRSLSAEAQVEALQAELERSRDETQAALKREHEKEKELNELCVDAVKAEAEAKRYREGWERSAQLEQELEQESICAADLEARVEAAVERAAQAELEATRLEKQLAAAALAHKEEQSVTEQGYVSAMQEQLHALQAEAGRREQEMNAALEEETTRGQGLREELICRQTDEPRLRGEVDALLEAKKDSEALVLALQAEVVRMREEAERAVKQEMERDKQAQEVADEQEEALRIIEEEKQRLVHMMEDVRVLQAEAANAHKEAHRIVAEERVRVQDLEGELQAVRGGAVRDRAEAEAALKEAAERVAFLEKQVQTEVVRDAGEEDAHTTANRVQHEVTCLGEAEVPLHDVMLRLRLIDFALHEVIAKLEVDCSDERGGADQLKLGVEEKRCLDAVSSELSNLVKQHEQEADGSFTSPEEQSSPIKSVLAAAEGVRPYDGRNRFFEKALADVGDGPSDTFAHTHDEKARSGQLPISLEESSAASELNDSGGSAVHREGVRMLARDSGGMRGDVKEKQSEGLDIVAILREQLSALTQARADDTAAFEEAISAKENESQSVLRDSQALRAQLEQAEDELRRRDEERQRLDTKATELSELRVRLDAKAKEMGVLMSRAQEKAVLEEKKCEALTRTSGELREELERVTKDLTDVRDEQRITEEETAALAVELQAAQNEIAELGEKNEELSSQIEDLEYSLSSARAEAELRDRQVEELETGRQHMQEELLKLQAALEKALQARDDAARASSEAVRDAASLREELEALAVLLSSTADNASERERLEADVGRLQAEVEAALSNVYKSAAESKAASEAEAKAVAAAEAAAHEANDLRGRLQAVAQQLQEKEAQLKELSSQRDAARSLQNVAMAAAADHEAQVADVTERLRSVTAEKEGALREVEESLNMRMEAEQSLDVITAEKDALLIQAAELCRAREGDGVNLERLSERVAAVELEKQDLESHLEDVKRQLERRDELLSLANEAAQSASAEVEALQKKLKQAKEDLKQVPVLAAEVKAAEAAREAMRKDLTTALAELHVTREKLGELQSAYEDERGRAAELEGRLVIFRYTAEQEVLEQLRQAQAGEKAALEEVAELEARVMENEVKIEQLVQGTVDVASRFEALEGTLRKERERCVAAEGRLSQLQELNQVLRVEKMELMSEATKQHEGAQALQAQLEKERCRVVDFEARVEAAVERVAQAEAEAGRLAEELAHVYEAKNEVQAQLTAQQQRVTELEDALRASQSEVASALEVAHRASARLTELESERAHVQVQDENLRRAEIEHTAALVEEAEGVLALEQSRFAQDKKDLDTQRRKTEALNAELLMQKRIIDEQMGMLSREVQANLQHLYNRREAVNIRASKPYDVEHTNWGQRCRSDADNKASSAHHLERRSSCFADGSRQHLDSAVSSSRRSSGAYMYGEQRADGMDTDIRRELERQHSEAQGLQEQLHELKNELRRAHSRVEEVTGRSRAGSRRTSSHQSTHDPVMVARPEELIRLNSSLRHVERRLSVEANMVRRKSLLRG